MNVGHLIKVEDRTIKVVLGLAIVAFVAILGSCSYLMAAVIFS